VARNCMNDNDCRGDFWCRQRMDASGRLLPGKCVPPENWYETYWVTINHGDTFKMRDFGYSVAQSVNDTNVFQPPPNGPDLVLIGQSMAAVWRDNDGDGIYDWEGQMMNIHPDWTIPMASPDGATLQIQTNEGSNYCYDCSQHTVGYPNWYDCLTHGGPWSCDWNESTNSCYCSTSEWCEDEDWSDGTTCGPCCNPVDPPTTSRGGKGINRNSRSSHLGGRRK